MLGSGWLLRSRSSGNRRFLTGKSPEARADRSLQTWRGWPSTAGSASPAAPTMGRSKWCRVDTATDGESPPWRCAPRPLGSEPRHTSAASTSRRSALFPSRSTEKSSTWRPIRRSSSTALRPHDGQLNPDVAPDQIKIGHARRCSDGLGFNCWGMVRVGSVGYPELVWTRSGGSDHEPSDRTSSGTEGATGGPATRLADKFVRNLTCRHDALPSNHCRDVGRLAGPWRAGRYGSQDPWQGLRAVISDGRTVTEVAAAVVPDSHPDSLHASEKANVTEY